jgi:hypothetical protein
MALRASDWIEVRSKEEILATLDKNGRLEGLPFMPQMLKYCGRRFQVYKRAHKTCDTVSGKYVGRLLPNGIHLDLRCDGEAYGGCQAACLIFWKDAWLKPVSQNSPDSAEQPQASENRPAGCSETDVLQGTRAPEQSSSDNIRYVCQATELLNFTSPLKWWDARHYVEDVESGNVSVGKMMPVFTYFAFYYGTFANRRTLGRPARWIHEVLRSIWGGEPMVRSKGKLPPGDSGPVVDLKLQPGDLVRVKPFTEILATINSNNFNRGLFFDAEMVPNCGKTYRVRTRIEKFVDERTGFMKRMKTPAVILDGAFCQSRYSDNRLFCPRSIYAWWREIWLERIPEAAVLQNPGDSGTKGLTGVVRPSSNGRDSIPSA